MDLVMLSIAGFLTGIGLGHLKHKYLGTSSSPSTGISSSQHDSDWDNGFTIDAEFHYVDEDTFSSSCSSVNPATGLIMMGDCTVDVAGNPYGVDMHHDIGGDGIDWY